MTVKQMGADRSPNNLQKPTYIGKDEQLLSYVMIPEILNKIYFYYLEYIQVEGGPVQVSAETPFAQVLLDEGITNYPSPYRVSLGESPTDPTGTKRKDENSKTETTLLNPEMIIPSLSKETNAVLTTVFQYYTKAIAEAKASPGYKDLQLGGSRKTKKTRYHRHKPKRRTKRRSKKHHVKRR